MSGCCVLFPARFFAGAVLACVRLSSSVPSVSPVVAAAGLAVAASLRLAAVARRCGQLRATHPIARLHKTIPHPFQRVCLCASNNILVASRSMYESRCSRCGAMTTSGSAWCQRCTDEHASRIEREDRKADERAQAQDDRAADAEARASQSEEMTALQEAVRELKRTMEEKVEELNRTMEAVLARLDLMLDTPAQEGSLPPAAFFSELHNWMRSHPTPRHIAINVRSRRQVREVTSLLDNHLTGSVNTRLIDHTVPIAGVLVGVLTNMEAGDVLIVTLPELMRASIQEHLSPVCSTGKLSITVDQGPGARAMQISLPDFRIVFVTLRPDRLPGGVKVVWPADQ